MKQIETDVVWLQAPKDKMAAEKLVDYENIEKILADYENTTIGNEKMDNPDSEETGGGDYDTEDYEKPVPQVQDAPPIPPKPLLLPHEFPPAPPPAPEREPILLPTPKVRKEDILQKIKEKARLGFDKVHEQLLKRTKQKTMQAHEGNTGDKKQKQSVLYSRSKSESGGLRESKGSEKKSLSISVSEGDDKGVDDKQSQRLSKAYDVNRYRPLPALPPKPNINVTDDDKLDMYDDVDDKEEAFLRDMESFKLQKASDTNLNTLARYPDLNKIGRAKQTDEDFYSYTVDELVECLKMCSLDKLAIDCNANKLDGGFFRGFDLNVLKSEPFCLSNLDVFKVKKIINEGWRPKSKQ